MERWVIPHFRGCRLDEIEPPDVRDFIVQLDEAGIATEQRASDPRTAQGDVSRLRSRMERCGANPTVNVRIGSGRDVAEGEREVRAMTRAELAVFCGYVPEQSRLLFEFLAHTGLRISEAVGLTWANVEFGKAPRLLVRRQDCRGEVGPLKSASSRRDIPLSPGMARRLWTVRGSQGKTERVFTSPEGFPLAYGNLRRRVLVPATEAAGLPWVTFHTFRHTCASLLFEAGRDLKQVSEWLGHADAGFTLKVYVHLMDAGVGDAAFMDEVVKVGNGWATQGPVKAANDEPEETAKTA